MKLKKYARYRESGMTLLEVLISMLVVGTGLAMTISMLYASNRYGNAAEYRAIAINDMRSIIDSMRANKLGAIVYTGGTAPTSTDANKQAAITSATTMAKADIALWDRYVANDLPNGDYTISVINASTGTYQIRMQWDLVNQDKSLEKNPSASTKTDQLVITFAL